MSSPLAVSRFRFVFAACWLLWMLLQVLVLGWYGFPLMLALTDSIICNGLLIGTCILIAMLFNYYLPTRERYSHILALVAMLSVIWLFISRSLLMLITQNSAGYTFFFTQSLPIRLVIGFLIIGSMALISVLWYTLQYQKESDKRRTDAERLAKEAELFKLRQQLQPHFLFNSLNSINALIGLKPQQARTMIQQLSDFLRSTLKKEENSIVSLHDELQHLQLYLEIEKVRFGHRLTTIIQTDEKDKDAKIPAMLLQPIVENAIKFGLYDTIDAITILIQTEVVNNDLIIVVQNPFDPLTSLPNTGTGFGMASVQRRLYLLFSRNDLLHTSATGTLFTTTIKIPQG